MGNIVPAGDRGSICGCKGISETRGTCVDMGSPRDDASLLGVAGFELAKEPSSVTSSVSVGRSATAARELSSAGLASRPSVRNRARATSELPLAASDSRTFPDHAGGAKRAQTFGAFLSRTHDQDRIQLRIGRTVYRDFNLQDGHGPTALPGFMALLIGRSARSSDRQPLQARQAQRARCGYRNSAGRAFLAVSTLHQGTESFSL
jgi:hypothetical protein